MKVLAIQSSPNHEGLTAKTAKAVLKGANSKDAETELIHLNDLELLHCIACEDGWGICRTEGICILKDEFNDLVEKIKKIDVLVFATPVYWHNISESAKVFLDRLRRVERHSRFTNFKGKKTIGIAAAGGSGHGASRALYLLEEYLKRLGFDAFDLVTITQASRGHKLPMLEEAGERIVD